MIMVWEILKKKKINCELALFFFALSLLVSCAKEQGNNIERFQLLRPTDIPNNDLILLSLVNVNKELKNIFVSSKNDSIEFCSNKMKCKKIQGQFLENNGKIQLIFVSYKTSPIRNKVALMQYLNDNYSKIKLNVFNDKKIYSLKSNNKCEYEIKYLKMNQIDSLIR